MKITFISPFPDLSAFGLRSVSDYLRKAGHETKIIFLPDPESEKIAKAGEIYQYRQSTLEQVSALCKGTDLVGFSFFSFYFDRVVQLTRWIKKDLSIPVIWGGKHPSVMPEEALEYADIVCIGEGEESALELVEKMEQGRDYYDTPNMWFKKDGNIIKNPLKELMVELDNIPIHDYLSPSHFVWLKDTDDIRPVNLEILKRFFAPHPFSRDGRAYQTMTTRGCPFKCTYCSTFKDLYKGQKYVRQRSIENIIREFEGVKKRYPFVDLIAICDDEFLSLSAEKIKEFADKYKSRIGLPFTCLVSPWNAGMDKLRWLEDAGLKMLQMGIETTSENGKKIYRRNTADKIVLEAVQNIGKLKNGIIPLYDFIIDNPYESTDDMLETLEFILKIPRPYHLDIFSLILFPGTELYSRAVEEKRITPGVEIYRRVYRNYEKRYINFLFLMCNYRIPGFIMKILMNRRLVYLMEKRFLSECLFRGLEVMKSFNLMALAKRFRTLKPSNVS